MRVSATAKYIRRSTRKTRLVTAAKNVAMVLKSAAANAENNHNLAADELVIVDAIANEGPRKNMKRWRPRAQGRAFPIQKHVTHITIIVADQEA